MPMPERNSITEIPTSSDSEDQYVCPFTQPAWKQKSDLFLFVMLILVPLALLVLFIIR